MSSRKPARDGFALFRVGIAVVLLGGCAILQQLIIAPDIRITDISVAKAGFLQQVLNLELQLDNPNPIGLPLAGMSYTLELGGVEVGTGQQTRPVSLPANGKATWPLEFRIDSLKLIQGFLDRGSFKEMDYRIFGDLQFSESSSFPPLPFDKQGRVGN